MELLDEVIRIMTPNEMKTIRRMAGWTLRRLSAEAKISVTQLSQFECGVNGLRRDQVAVCERLLLRAAAEREQAISALFNRRYAASAMEEAS
jgi:transcriptional regulator with XRE-family HTH domain